MKTIIIFLFLLVLSMSHRASQTQQRGRPTGRYTNLIEAQDNIGTDPSQYFVCGIQLRGREWTPAPRQKVGWKGLDYFRARFKFFQNKEPTYRNMTNGINIFFCNQRDWSNQIKKSFETGSKNNSQWRESVMCPAGTYATSIAPKFAVIKGKDQGLTGIQLSCTTPSYDNSHLVDDKTTSTKFELLKGQEGTFISGLRIRQERGHKLSGILVAFEPMPKITNFNFAFNALSDVPLETTQIHSVSETNLGAESIQSTLRTQKEAIFKNTWQLDGSLSHINGYLIEIPTTSGLFPSADPSADPVQHLKDPQSFAFNRELQSTLFVEKQTLTLIPSCSTLTIATMLPLKAVLLPFNLTVTFSSQFNDKQIGTSTYTGVWKGTITGQVDLIPNDVRLLGCNSPMPPIVENLRTDSP